MSYRYYCLTRYRGGNDSASTGELSRHLKSLELTMKDYRFSGEDPILIFDFLSRIMEECKILELTEANAYDAFAVVRGTSPVPYGEGREEI